jgi:transposase
MNGILYQLKNGCNWCDLPRDLPPIQPFIGTINNGEPLAY